MSEVVIVGIGQVPVGEYWDVSLRSLGVRAIRAALRDAGALQPSSSLKPGALYIGNMLASTASHQSNLGALMVECAALGGIEGITVEAAGASGGAAFRLGYMAVASGYVDCALVLGVEKHTDQVGPGAEAAVTQMLDYDYEAVQGLTPTSQAALLMQRYLHEYKPPRAAFGAFPVLAHANAVNNPNAMFRRAISQKLYDESEPYTEPLNLFDIAPYADGAAAALLARSDLVKDPPHPLVRVTGSALAGDRLALHDRHDLLDFNAATLSIRRACSQAGILPGDVDLFELCDAYSIYAVLSLEAAGFAPRGEGWKLAQEGGLGLKSRLPICTMGGIKARGNPIGAAGMYQVVEAVQQLRGEAGANQVSGANQVAGARRALVQCLGGPAVTAATHVLERWDK
jgi:acetyl-CoA C-acetyltransferase